MYFQVYDRTGLHSQCMPEDTVSHGVAHIT